jgi:photosystem II stability/assembly factor-like uncharacterized protein
MRALLLAVIALAGCDEPFVFNCTDDSQCVRAGVHGVCVSPQSVCALPSTTCGSGFAFDRTAGGLAGQCADLPDGGIPDLSTNFDQGPGDDASIGGVDLAPAIDLLHIPAWTASTSGTSAALKSVWGTTGGGAIYAVGTSGTILRSQTQGASWTPLTSGTGANLYAIWGSGPNDIWVGGDGVVLHSTDGTAWSKVTISTSYALIEGVYGTGSTNVVLVGSGTGGANVYRSIDGGSNWVTTTVTNCAGALGCLAQGVFGAGARAYTVVLGVPANSQSIYASSNSGGSWALSTGAPTNITFRGGWAADESEAYAVGQGNIYRTNNQGLSWSPQTNPTSAVLYAAWGSGPLDVYLVGSAGTILHSANHGATWDPETSPTSQTLSAVWGSGPADIYAVGDGGTILRFH